MYFKRIHIFILVILQLENELRKQNSDPVSQLNRAVNDGNSNTNDRGKDGFDNPALISEYRLTL